MQILGGSGDDSSHEVPATQSANLYCVSGSQGGPLNLCLDLSVGLAPHLKHEATDDISLFLSNI